MWRCTNRMWWLPGKTVLVGVVVSFEEWQQQNCIWPLSGEVLKIIPCRSPSGYQLCHLQWKNTNTTCCGNIGNNLSMFWRLVTSASVHLRWDVDRSEKSFSVCLLTSLSASLLSYNPPSLFPALFLSPLLIGPTFLWDFCLLKSFDSCLVSVLCCGLALTKIVCVSFWNRYSAGQHTPVSIQCILFWKILEHQSCWKQVFEDQTHWKTNEKQMVPGHSSSDPTVHLLDVISIFHSCYLKQSTSYWNHRNRCSLFLCRKLRKNRSHKGSIHWRPREYKISRFSPCARVSLVHAHFCIWFYLRILSVPCISTSGRKHQVASRNWFLITCMLKGAWSSNFSFGISQTFQKNLVFLVSLQVILLSFTHLPMSSTFFYRNFAGRMKYLVLTILSVLMAVYLQRSEDSLIPVGALVETMRSFGGSAFIKLQSFAVCSKKYGPDCLWWHKKSKKILDLEEANLCCLDKLFFRMELIHSCLSSSPIEMTFSVNVNIFLSLKLNLCVLASSFKEAWRK